MNDATLNSTQKAALTMRLLRDEVAQPTPNGVPGAADPRNHDTVAAHLVGELQGADLTTLRRAQSTAAGETRQLLSLALLQAGDPAGDADVRAVLRDQKNHRLNVRLLAAQALAGQAETAEDTVDGAELGRFLAQVIWDETQWRAVGGAGKRAGAGEYPVRKLAVAAIRTLERRGVKLDSYVVAAAQQAVTEFDGPPAQAVAK